MYERERLKQHTHVMTMWSTTPKSCKLTGGTSLIHRSVAGFPVRAQQQQASPSAATPRHACSGRQQTQHDTAAAVMYTFRVERHARQIYTAAMPRGSSMPQDHVTPFAFLLWSTKNFTPASGRPTFPPPAGAEGPTRIIWSYPVRCNPQLPSRPYIYFPRGARNPNLLTGRCSQLSPLGRKTTTPTYTTTQSTTDSCDVFLGPGWP